MKIKVSAFILILLMIASVTTVFAAGNSDNGSQTAGNEEGFPIVNEEGFPIVNEPITLKVLTYKHEISDPFEENEIFMALEEKTGVTIEWEYTGADWDAQKPLLLISDDLPDVFIGTVTKADVVKNASLFLPLEDYIDQYCPNITAMFEETPEIKKFITAPDGHIYGLPQMMPTAAVTIEAGMINKSWLDNLGLTMPETTGDLYSVLKAFKENDANGNGDPNDEIPLSFMGFQFLTGCYGLIGSFGVPTSPMSPTISVTDDGEVKFAMAEEGFKDFVIYMNMLSNEGLIDEEAFTHDWTIYPAKVNPEGDAFVGMTFHWTIGAAVGGEKAEQYAYYMPVKHEGASTYWRENSAVYSDYRFMISSSCENPEVAMRWADSLFDPETSLQIAFGTIGTTLNKIDDAHYELLLPPEGVDSSTWEWKYSMNSSGVGYVTEEIRDNLVITGDRADKYNVEQKYSQYFAKNTYPLVTYTAEQMDELAILEADINGYWEEQVATWIVNGGIEDEWDNYLEQLGKMGLERLVEIYQSAYDAFYN